MSCRGSRHRFPSASAIDVELDRTWFYERRGGIDFVSHEPKPSISRIPWKLLARSVDRWRRAGTLRKSKTTKKRSKP